MSKLKAPVIISLPYDTEEAEVEYIRKDIYDDLRTRVKEAVEEIEKVVEAYKQVTAPAQESGKLCIAILNRHGLIEEE